MKYAIIIIWGVPSFINIGSAVQKRWHVPPKHLLIFALCRVVPQEIAFFINAGVRISNPVSSKVGKLCHFC
jgi:hypothetical protein